MKKWSELPKRKKVIALSLIAALFLGLLFGLSIIINPQKYVINDSNYIVNGYDLRATCKQNGFVDIKSWAWTGTKNETILLVCSDVSNASKFLAYALVQKNFVRTPWN